MMASDRFYCTAERPWTEADGPSVHENAKVIRAADDTAFSSGNKTRYRCPHCEIEFEVTEADY